MPPMKYDLSSNGHVAHPSRPEAPGITGTTMMSQQEVVDKLNELSKENWEMGRTIARYLTQCCVCACELELPDELAHCESCRGDMAAYEE